jgi:hypothetical protein
MKTVTTTHKLAAQVQASYAETGAIAAFPLGVDDKLTAAKQEFMLAPDPYIDTVRLPTTVVSLSTLFAYLRTIKGLLESRDNNVKNADWDVAKNGQLKLYKAFVCSIHALSNFLDDAIVTTSALPAFVKEVAAHARTRPPAGLSVNGATMWTKFFEGDHPRTLATLATLTALCLLELAAIPAITPRGGADIGAGLTANKNETPEDDDDEKPNDGDGMGLDGQVTGDAKMSPVTTSQVL